MLPSAAPVCKRTRFGPSRLPILITSTPLLSIVFLFGISDLTFSRCGFSVEAKQLRVVILGRARAEIRLAERAGCARAEV